MVEPALAVYETKPKAVIQIEISEILATPSQRKLPSRITITFQAKSCSNFVGGGFTFGELFTVLKLQIA